MISSPVVRSVQPVVTCTTIQDFYLFDLSGQEGHTKKSCAIQKAEDDPDSVSEDDLAFWSFVREEERPSTMRGVQEREDEEGSGDESDYSSDEIIE